MVIDYMKNLKKYNRKKIIIMDNFRNTYSGTAYFCNKDDYALRKMVSK